MSMFSPAVGFAVALAWLSAAMAQPQKGEPETVTISLDQIWAHNMPGTRDVRDLEPDVFGEGTKEISRQERVRREKASLFNQIGGTLRFIPEGKTVAKGFAVIGTGKQALRNAHAVLVKKRTPPQSFSTEKDISIFFFSHLFGRYVRLVQVERRNTLIEISYRFVPHETKQMTAHYALIPLGKLPAGKYRVDIVRLPLEQKYLAQRVPPVDPQWDRRVVCHPFSFTVVE